MKRPRTTVTGDIMTVELPYRSNVVLGAASLVLTAFFVSFAALAIDEPERTYIMAAGPLGLVAGLYFLGLRQQLVLDRSRGTVCARGSWFVGRWETAESIQGRPFGVERSEQRNDGATTTTYAVVLGELQLARFPASSDAEKLATALAEHMGVDRTSTRDSKDLRAAMKRRQKYALLPIALVCVALMAGGVILALGGFG